MARKNLPDMLRNTLPSMPKSALMAATGRLLSGFAARAIAGAAVVVALASGVLLVSTSFTSAHAETLEEALASAYQYSPRLDAERARLRATDENVARAMSGYRPQIDATGDVNMIDNKTRPPSLNDGTIHPKGYRIDAVQPIFRGGQTFFAVSEADAQVAAGQQTLRDTEQTLLLEVVTAYMDVIRDQAIVRLRENNVNVLSRELKATQDRFAVGEVTKTDVAQSQARRAGAVSDLELARANLKISRANFERSVGHPPSNLVEPSNYNAGLPSSIDQAVDIGTHGHPQVVAALFREQAARHAIDRIRGQLLPQVQLEASWSNRFDTSRFTDETETATVTGRLSVPIYQGGEVYAQVRQAKHEHLGRIQDIEEARTQVEARVVTNWSQTMAVRAQVQSDSTQVSANSTALAGVREEERVGQRTLLDVLNAELELLNSQVQLETTRRNLVVTSYSLRSAIGLLDVANLGVASVIYDPEVHHLETRRKWIGTRITDDDPWRAEVVPEPVK
ncbi:MAG: TolC family outer membrane protein [Hyphomicrobium sp.]